MRNERALIWKPYCTHTNGLSSGLLYTMYSAKANAMVVVLRTDG